MKRKFTAKTGTLALAAIAILNTSFTNQKVLILHCSGQNCWSILNVSVNALSGHAHHGDVYLTSYCPVSGPEWACRPQDSTSTEPTLN